MNLLNRIASIIGLALVCSMSAYGQSTLVRAIETGTTGSINDLASRASSNGITTIFAGEPVSGSSIKTVSILRVSAEGVKFPVESSTETFTGFSIEGLCGLVDSIGRYFYIAKFQDQTQSNRYLLRSSSEASGGPTGGWVIDLGPVSPSNPLMCDGYDQTFVEVILPSSTGFRLLYIKKTTGEILLDKAVTFPNFSGATNLVAGANGRTCLIVFNANADTSVLCFDKTGTEIWRRSVQLVEVNPSGPVTVRVFKSVIVSPTRILIAHDRDFYSTASQFDMVLEDVNLQTGSTISQAAIGFPEQNLQVAAGRFLANGDLSILIRRETTTGWTAARLSPSLGVLWSNSFDLIGGNSPLTTFQSLNDAEVDTAGNIVVASATADPVTVTQGSTTVPRPVLVMKYIDNQGTSRWQQTLSPVSPSRVGAVDVAFDQTGKIYTGFQFADVVGGNPQFATSKLHARQFQPAKLMPIAADARATFTSVLYQSADGVDLRLVRSGTPNTVANITTGTTFNPLSIYTMTTGAVQILLSGLTAGSARIITVPPNSSVPSATMNFTLPANSGALRDVAVDSSGRVWVTSQILIGQNSYLVKYHRVNTAGTAVDLTRTQLVANFPSGVFGFDATGTDFRFGCTTEGSALTGTILTASSSGAFGLAYTEPISGVRLQDLRNSPSGKSYALFSDTLGLAPGKVWRTNTVGSALETSFDLPTSPGLIPLGIGSVDNINCRVVWHEIGGKIHFRNMTGATPGPVTILPALMN